MRSILESHASKIMPIDVHDPSLIVYLPLWYPYSDLTGATTLYSYDKYRHTFTNTGSTWTTTGRSLTGNDDYIATPDHSVFNVGANLSVIVWVNRAAENTKALVTQWDNNGQIAWGIHDSSGKVWLRYTSDGTLIGGNVTNVTSNAVYFDSTWRMIGVTINGNAPVLYVNGLAVAQTISSSDANTIFNSTSKLGIGCDYTLGIAGNKSNGLYGELIIYNKTISASEMANIYDATKWRYK